MERPLSEDEIMELAWDKIRSSTDCLINDYGVRVKLIIRRYGVKCSELPGGERNGREVGYFRPYFVFDTYPPNSKEPDYYQIGPTPDEDDILGWVAADDAVRWDHHVADRPDRSSGRTPRLYVFASESDAIEWVTAQTEGRTSDITPIAQSSLANTGLKLMPWPIIEKRLVTINGHEFEFHKITFLGHYEKGTDLSKAMPVKRASSRMKDTAKAGLSKEFHEAVRMLDVVFVIDVTGSMAPVIDAVKIAAKYIAKGIEGNVKGTLKQYGFMPDIAFGMVGYRDYGDENLYEVYPLVNNIGSFEQAVNPVKAAGGGDMSEAVYQGIDAALRMTNWRGVIHRGKAGLSTRVIVLIGDHSAHEPAEGANYNVSAHSLVQLAKNQQKNVTMYSICCQTDGNESEKRRHRSQFSYLAQGTGGECCDLSQASQVIGKIGEIIKDRLEGKVRGIVQVADALEKGTLTKAPEGEVPDTLPEMPYEQYTEILELFEAAGVDLSSLRPGVPVFSTGWVCTESTGIQILHLFFFELWFPNFFS